MLTALLRTSGGQVLPALDQALARAARHLYGRLTDAGVPGLTLKTRLHARLIGEFRPAASQRLSSQRQLCMFTMLGNLFKRYWSLIAHHSDVIASPGNSAS